MGVWRRKGRKGKRGSSQVECTRLALIVNTYHMIFHLYFDQPRYGERTTGKQPFFCCFYLGIEQKLQPTVPATLQQAQTSALLSLLNLNQPVESTIATSKSGSGFKPPPASAPPVWKILVLDQQTKDVLATVLHVQDLRDSGVTLHV